MKVRLRDCVQLVKSRVSTENAIRENYVSTDNMIVNRGGVNFGESNLPQSKTVNDYQKGDVLVSNIRPYFKKIWFADRNGTRSGDVLCFRKTDESLTDEYLYCILQSDHFFDYVVSTSKGTKMPRGDKEAILEYEFDLPNKEVQYDKYRPILLVEQKMTLNKKINDNLANIIDIKFEHFIRNRPLKKLPISSLGTVIGGGTPNKKIAEYWSDGTIPWVTPKDLSKNRNYFTSNGSLYITDKGLEKSSARMMPAGTILYSSRAPIGYISIANNPITTNQGFKSVIPDKEYPTEFIFVLLKRETRGLISSANGSTFKEISGTQLKNYQVNIPSKKECQRFSEEVRPMFMTIKKLEQENESLSKLKTLLLSKYF